MIEDKIYGLIAAAEEMLKVCKETEGMAKDAILQLPDAARRAVFNSVTELLPQEAKKASEGILRASNQVSMAAREVQDTLRKRWLIAVGVLVLAPILTTAALYFGSGHVISSRLAEAERLSNQVAKLKAQGGKIEVEKCDGRLCVRVDERAGRYGEKQKGETYMVLFGY